MEDYSFVLIRGDTDKVGVNFKEDDFQEEEIPKVGDELRFTVRTKYSDQAVIEKKIVYPENIFDLEEGDTIKLKPGKYAYDIEYRKPDNSLIKTIVIGEVTLIKDMTHD